MTDKLITHDEARKENNLLMENHVQLTKEKYDWCPQMVDRRKSHYKKIDDYITQQEQFAKDVARYFELNYKQYNEGIQNEECDEYMALEEKLTKGVVK